MHLHFFRKLSQNLDYVKRFCNDRRNPFHFAIRERSNTCMNDDGTTDYYPLK